METDGSAATWAKRVTAFRKTLGTDVRTTDDAQSIASLQQDLIALRSLSASGDANLPAYERKKRQEVLSELERELLRVTTAGPSAAPAATKFAFGRRKAAVASPAALALAAAPVVAPIIDRSIASASTPSLQRASASELHESASDPASTYSDLQNTVIDLRDMQPSVLFLSRLRQCIVLAPSVLASVLIRGAENSIFWLGCHQLRMHNATDVEVLVDTQSIPIVEDCKHITFGLLSADSRNLQVDNFNEPGAPSSGSHIARLSPEAAQARLQGLLQLIDSARSAHEKDDIALKVHLSALPILQQLGLDEESAPLRQG